MRRAWAAIVLAGAAAAGAAQVQIHPPGLPQSSSYADHGTPLPAELAEIALGGYLRRAVRTRGTLTPLDTRGEYFELSEGGKVVLIPVRELGDALRSLSGRRVEVVGLVRPLVEQQGTCRLPDGGRAPESYCTDPDLPPTPDLVGMRASWPRTSITAWSVSDITPLERRRGGSERLTLADVLAEEAPSDKTIQVIGRFCGANLCGGLEGPPHPSAWVLKDEDAAVWVIGKEPRGKGWHLDPNDKGDTARWLEVTGRMQPCGSSRCLHARSVALVARPRR